MLSRDAELVMADKPKKKEKRRKKKEEEKKDVEKEENEKEEFLSAQDTTPLIPKKTVVEEAKPPPSAPVSASSPGSWFPNLIDDVRSSARGAWTDLGLGTKEFSQLVVHNALLVATAYAFCFVGGVVFRILEGWHEVEHKCHVQRTRHDLINELWETSSYLEQDVWVALARDRLKEFEAAVQAAKVDGGINTPSTVRVWSFWGSLHYALTVITSIGYGHIVPNTDTGRALTMVYAAVGIPLLLMVLADLGKVFTRTIKFLWAFVRRFFYTGSCRAVRKAAPVKAVGKVIHQFSRKKEGDLEGEDGEEEPPAFTVDENFDLPVSIALVLLLLYILAGGLLFIQWEDEWSYFQAVYFVFVSLSTIGFGDFVPRHPAFMMATFVYLLFGLALTSMCINVVQESLSHTFKKATEKLSSHMGFYVEGAGEEVARPVAVELASVHKNKSE